MAGVGGWAVHATGKKLSHARRNVVNGSTPKAVQLPATHALVPEKPRQPCSTLPSTVSMGLTAVYGCRPSRRQARSASSPWYGSSRVMPREEQTASADFSRGQLRAFPGLIGVKCVPSRALMSRGTAGVVPKAAPCRARIASAKKYKTISCLLCYFVIKRIFCLH